MIIAIDGPAGSGKSTIARLLAKKLGLLYVDTGAMYRALTLKALKRKVNLVDSKALIDLARKTKMKLLLMPNKGLKVYLDGKDVTSSIRLPEVTEKVFYIARIAGVRAQMVKLQRSVAKGAPRGAVLEGRDIGTVVFPDALRKFYLDASVSKRAKRRYKDLLEAGHRVFIRKLEQDIKARDRKDRTRKTAPLKKAPDAIYIDTTNLNIQQVLDKVASYI